MPPRQVYGKKRIDRGGYDPDAIFGSLHLQKSSPSSERSDAEVVEKFGSLKIGGGGSGEKNGVLAALDGNALPRLDDSKKVGRNGRKKTGRRKKAVEDSEEEWKEDDNGHGTTEKGKPSVVDRTDGNDSGVARSTINVAITNSEDDDLSLTGHDPGLLVCQDRTKSHWRNNGRFEPTSDTLAWKTAPTVSNTGNEYTTHCSELLSLSSHQLTDFHDWAEQLKEHFHLTKIAEASFGEVYRLSLRQRLSGFSSNDESVLKIVPLRPQTTISETADRRKRDALAKKTADMSSPSDVANEIRLLQRMSGIPGFTNFRDVRVLRGNPPPTFQKAYKDFNTMRKTRGKDTSHFPDPAKKTSYTPDQLWAVIEMQDAGTDLEQVLESSDSQSIFQVWDIFWQVALSLAKGEEGAEFEHRDLHLGNICIRQHPDPSPNDTDFKHTKLHFSSLETTIIDYTISRAALQTTDNENEAIAFHDLSTPETASLFEADSTHEYQYDIYRYMRGMVLRNDACADFTTTNTVPLQPPSHRENTWRQFHPISNLIWLHYILYKLLEQVSWPSEAGKAPPRRLRDQYARWKKGIDLEHVLLRVQDLLDPGVLSSVGADGVVSTVDLVALALSEGWLDFEDVVGGEDVGVEEEIDEKGAVDLVEGFSALQLECEAVVDAEGGEEANSTDQKTESRRRPGRRKD